MPLTRANRKRMIYDDVVKALTAAMCTPAYREKIIGNPKHDLSDRETTQQYIRKSELKQTLEKHFPGIKAVGR